MSTCIHYALHPSRTIPPSILSGFFCQEQCPPSFLFVCLVVCSRTMPAVLFIRNSPNVPPPGLMQPLNFSPKVRMHRSGFNKKPVEKESMIHLSLELNSNISALLPDCWIIMQTPIPIDMQVAPPVMLGRS